MKTLLIIITLFIFSTSTTDFCGGWEVGYTEGFCYDQFSTCIAPLTPLCPLANLDRDTYADGYNRGFVKGLEDYREQN